MVVYPKNPRVYLNSYRKMPKDSSNITKIVMGSHTGTHVDAPSHQILGSKKTVDKLDLKKFVGPCRVLDMTHCRESVGVWDLKKERVKRGERILVKTRNSLRGFKRFYNDFVYLDGEAAEYLASRGILLFGIDYLSVKKRGGEDNRPHIALLKKEIALVEGLDLSRVAPGSYELIVLPLRIMGIDGAPARAVLLK